MDTISGEDFQERDTCVELYYQGKYEDSLRCLLQQADAPDADLAMVYYRVAFCYWRLNDVEYALSAVDKAIAFEDGLLCKREQYPSMALFKGECMYTLKRWSEAIAAFNLAIAHSPDGRNSLAAYYIGKCFSELNSPFQAIKAFEKSLEDGLDQKKADAFFEIGYHLYKLKHYSAAIDPFSNAMLHSIDGKHPGASLFKGVCLSELGHYEEALFCYTKTIEDDVQHSHMEVYHNVGLIWDLLGNYQEAISAYKKAAGFATNRARADSYCNLGICYGKLGHYEEAIWEFDNALALSSEYKFPLATYNRALALDRQGKPGQALDSLDKTIEDAGGYYPTAWLRKAEILFRLSKFKEARHAAYAALLQENDLKEAITFIYEKFNPHEAYASRIRYLNLLLIQISLGSTDGWTEASTIFRNFGLSDSAQLYIDLLLSKKDLLHSGKTYVSRLREAYLIAASRKQFEQVYYIIDTLLDTEEYVLGALDKFFYLVSASHTAASEKELRELLLNSSFTGFTIKQTDEYLFSLVPEYPLEMAVSAATNETEQELLKDYHIKDFPYVPNFSQKELLHLLLGAYFRKSGEVGTIDFESDAWLNFDGSLSRDKIVPSQVAANIDELLDGSSDDLLYHVLSQLMQRQEDCNVNGQDILLLKAYSILKHGWRKNVKKNQQTTIVRFSKELLATVAADLASGATSISFLVAFGFTYLLDFVLNTMEDKILTGQDLNWKHFVEKVARKD